MGLQLEIRYYFDGEPNASIAYDPAKANGQQFGAVMYGGAWRDGTAAATGNASMFQAGDKMGKNAVTGAWYNVIPPFLPARSVTGRNVL